MLNKNQILEQIGNDARFYNLCKRLCPQNYKDVYSEFLYIICLKPIDFFDEHIEKKCFSVIHLLRLPNSKVNFKSQKQKNTIELDFDIVAEAENYSEKKMAIEYVLRNEKYWYNLRIFELILQGNSLTDIRKMTKNQLPYNELVRVNNLFKDKIKQQYQRLCSQQ